MLSSASSASPADPGASQPLLLRRSQQSLHVRLRRRRVHRRPERLWQIRKDPYAELPEIDDIDHAVVVVIEVRQEAGLTGVQAVARREQSEVGDVHATVAVGVAIVAEE